MDDRKVKEHYLSLRTNAVWGMERMIIPDIEKVP
jgi:hypothetical protein